MAELDFLSARLLVPEERWREAIGKLEGAYSALVTRANQLNDEARPLARATISGRAT